MGPLIASDVIPFFLYVSTMQVTM